MVRHNLRRSKAVHSSHAINAWLSREQRDYSSAFDRVARAEVANAGALAAGPLQHHEIVWQRGGIIITFAYQHERTIVDQSGRRGPIVDARIVAEMVRRFLAVQAAAVDELKLDVIGQHVTDGVEVPRAE